jgi:hypothetical protein
MQKQRDFQAEMVFSQNGGGHGGAKSAFSREKSEIAMVLTPANDPDSC